ncbi:MAG: transporter substrate-binding domain-containing protein [Proteobacteria bacterium]|nr:transporter substrate-binding domain-containing protein [Pseudomonadota bacterium]MDA1331256.1 transporter substrate-binding domain-containing protein [Pseudomonadota bacterium]
MFSLRFLLLVMLVIFVSPLTTQTFARDDEERVLGLEDEYVYGRNRGPKIGYVEPEIFDPLSDPLYRAGYKNYRPIGVPDGFKKMTAMKRTEELGAILACADGWFWPFSRTARKNEPAGLEIELLNAVAKKHDLKVEMMWVNMATRFGYGAPGGAFDLSINRGLCDLVLGLTMTGSDEHQLDPSGIIYTKSFMSTGFVLVTPGPVKGLTSLDDVKRLNIKIGLPAYSPMSDYAVANNIPHETFFQNFRVVDAMLDGTVDAAMIWSGAISQAKLNRPDGNLEMVKGYIPIPEMRWNSAWGLKNTETEFKKFIDDTFEEMLKSGEIKRIVERYGMPFFPPVE